MILTRELTRALSDGERIVVTRSWEVRFTRVGGGVRVDGDQVSVSVHAPPKLAAIAAVERERPDTGTFPVQLDSAGMIVPEKPTDPGPIADLSEAADKVLAARSPAGRAQGRQFVAMVQNSGAQMLTRWPRELFYPAGPARENVRRIALPDSLRKGTVTVRFEASLDPSGHRLAHAERRIVTTLSDHSKTSVETWTLTPVE